jgi:hypothetical protein
MCQTLHCKYSIHLKYSVSRMRKTKLVQGCKKKQSGSTESCLNSLKYNFNCAFNCKIFWFFYQQASYVNCIMSPHLKQQQLLSPPLHQLTEITRSSLAFSHRSILLRLQFVPHTHTHTHTHRTSQVPTSCTIGCLLSILTKLEFCLQV